MNVYLFSLNPKASVRNQWDFGLVKSIFEDLGYDYSHDYSSFDNLDGGIVVLPARHHVGLEAQVNTELNKLPWVKLILVGDEESLFDINALAHPDLQIFVQNPRPGQHDNYFHIGTGYPKHFLENIPDFIDKDQDFFFAGQSTYHAPELRPPMNVNYRRKEMADELENIEGGKIIRSKGFTQGVEPKDYYADMARAKVAPCPSGPELPDTFRLFEALELGCVPIADERVHKFNKDLIDYKGYWQWFFGEQPPFPVAISGWSDAVEYAVQNYPKLNNECQAWWYRQKWKLKEALEQPKITVVIPVSPIKSHPNTHILDITIASVKHHLPQAKIIVTFDGVRQEQSHMEAAYNEHIRAVLYNHRDIYPVIFTEHTHQVGMMRAVLDKCSEYIVYVEQDTPFNKEHIDWQGCIESLKYVDLVRFHFESKIPEPHEYLMHGMVQGSKVPLLKTTQWSQRPHLTTKKFYEKVLTNFSNKALTFIEDKMHSVAQSQPSDYRLGIYFPEGSIERTYHLDGRQGGEKYDDNLIF